MANTHAKNGSEKVLSDLVVAQRRRPPKLTTSFFVTLSGAFGIITFADYFNLIGHAFKYIFFAFVTAAFVWMLIRAKFTRIGLNAPTIFLCFTIVTSIPFLVQIASGREPTSYLTAFAASLVYSMTLVFPLERYRIDPDAIQRFLLRWLLALGILYFGELIFRKASNLDYFLQFENLVAHTKAVTLLAALCLVALGRARLRTILATILLSIGCLALRPSSSFILGIAVCLPISLLLRFRRYRVAEYLCYAVILIAMLVPFLLYFSADLRQWVYTVETLVKVNMFNSLPNTQFRLVIMELAIDKFIASSWLFGELFSGPTNVFIAGNLPYWLDNVSAGVAAIHSDYVILVLQGGLIAYTLFNLALAMIVRVHIRRLKVLNSGTDVDARQAIIGIACPTVMALVIFCSANPFLQNYQVAFLLWFILAISEIMAVTAGRNCKRNAAERQFYGSASFTSRVGRSF